MCPTVELNLSRPSFILTSNGCSICDHFHYKTNKKKVRIFNNIFCEFSENFQIKILKILTVQIFFCSHSRSDKKVGYDRFSRFDVYWIKTNKQTEHMCSYTGVCVWVSAYLSVCMAEEDL